MEEAAGIVQQRWGDTGWKEEDVVRGWTRSGKDYLFLILLELSKPLHNSKDLMEADKYFHRKVKDVFSFDDDT